MNKLREVRQLYKEDQYTFGKRLGYTQSWISRMENDKEPIPKILDMLLDYMREECLQS